MKYAVVLVRFTPAFTRTMSGEFDSLAAAMEAAASEAGGSDWFFIMETMGWSIAAQGNPRDAYTLVPTGTAYLE